MCRMVVLGSNNVDRTIRLANKHKQPLCTDNFTHELGSQGCGRIKNHLVRLGIHFIHFTNEFHSNPSTFAISPNHPHSTCSWLNPGP